MINTGYKRYISGNFDAQFRCFKLAANCFRPEPPPILPMPQNRSEPTRYPRTVPEAKWLSDDEVLVLSLAFKGEEEKKEERREQYGCMMGQ